MANQTIRQAASALAVAALLSSCGTFKKDSGPIIVQAPPTATPQQLCQVTALAEERSAAIETVRGADMKGRQSSETFLRDKLRSYEANLEIAYRSMVSSCQLYANCLDRNGSDETRCLRSESNYADARSQFYDMVSQSQILAAEVRRLTSTAAQPAGNKRSQNTENREGRCKSECSTTANIFTDNCCPTK